MNKDFWEFSIGIVPGFLFGYRGYIEELHTTHVLYLGFIDINLVVFN